MSQARSQPRIALISAVADNGVIGHNNALLWRLRDDMRRFKAMTTGHAVIMGRKTWDSLGRALPDRRNIVISRQTNFGAPGAEIVRSLDEALARCAGDKTIFVIGGGQIYASALPMASELHITAVHCSPEGDASFPQVNLDEWTETAREEHKADEFNQYDFDFVTLLRRS